MDRTEENNRLSYIELSKRNIDNYIYSYNYKNAFGLLILVLERLNDNEKTEFIKYYSDNIQQFMTSK